MRVMPAGLRKNQVVNFDFARRLYGLSGNGYMPVRQAAAASLRVL